MTKKKEKFTKTPIVVTIGNTVEKKKVSPGDVKKITEKFTGR